MNTEKFIVRLTDEERQKLETFVKQFKGTSQTVKRAIVLLKADANGPNWTNEKIHELTGVALKTISNIRKQLVTEGFDVVLNRRKRRLPPVPKKLDGLQEAKLMATHCGSPPEAPLQQTLRPMVAQAFGQSNGCFGNC